MDIKKKLKNVEKKIVSFNEDFNEEETFLIFRNEKLLKEYLTVLSKDPNIWQNYNIIIDDTIPVDFLEGPEIINVVENILFNYCKNSHALSFSLIDDVLRAFECPNGTRNDLARKLTDIILSGKYDLYTDCDTYAMAILIKNDKKDIIAKIDSFDAGISEKMLENYYQYCLKNDITPIINFENLNTNLILKYLDSYSIESLLRLMVIIYDKQPEDIVLKISNKIIEKIMKHEGDIVLNFGIEGLSYKIPVDRANNIYKALYDKNYLAYAPELIKNNLISEEDFRTKLKEYILSNTDLDNKVLKRNIKYLEDEEIFSHLAKTNQISFLFSTKFLDLYTANKDKIITDLLKNKQLKELLNDSTFNEMSKNNDLVLELVKRGVIDTLTVDTRDSFLSDTNIRFLEKLVANYQIKLKPLVSTYSNGCNPLLLKLLIKNDYIKEFIIAAYNEGEQTTLVKDNLDKIITYIDQDITSLDCFTKKFAELIINNTKLQTYYAENDIYLTELLLNKVKEFHDNSIEYTMPFYKKFKDNIIKLYNIKEENLDVLCKRFGPKIIGYLDNENIRKLANIEKKDLKKVLDLFPEEKLSMAELNGAYISIREYSFSKEKTEQAETFSLLLQAINSNDQDSIKEIISQIDSYFDEKLFNILNEKYKLVESGFTLDNHYKLLLFLTTKARTSPNKDKYQNILHIICEYYVACKRTEYSNVDNIGTQLALPYKYDRKVLEDQLTKYIINYENDIDRMKDILKSLIDSGFSKNEVLGIFSLMRGERKAEDLPSNLIPRIKDFKKAIYKYIKDHYLLDGYIYFMGKKNMNLVRDYNLDKANTLDILRILSNIDIDNIKYIKDSDSLLYESLKDLFVKKKIHLLPTSISNILQTNYINVSYTEENIAAIINYYPEIYQYEQKKVFNRKKKKLVEITQKLNEMIVKGYENKATKIRKQKKQLEEELMGDVPAELTIMQALLSSETYKAVSSVFALILTPEDARLIKDNPEPNSADHKTKNNERLKEAVELTKLLFTRNEVTIPTFNKIIKVNDNTSIRAIVGNFTDPANLTHGERTSSCMRIGGVGENLFYNSLKNKNGFHIKFEDPKTGEYISRVSGFRKGNTVFLNEQRYSLNENIISDEELTEAIKIVSSMLVKESKKSSVPIENVIISKNNELEDYPDTVDLELGENGESINDVYNNINTSSCIVLATSSYDKFAPLKLNQDDLPIYLPARRTVKEVTDKIELSKYVNRIEAVKRLLAGDDYRLLTNKFNEQEILYALVNDEWYIYIDSDYHVFSDCLEVDERALEEYQENLKKIDLYIQELCEQKMER